MKRRNVEHWLVLGAFIAAGTVFYWTLFDNTPFKSTLMASYALSQSVQLTGPIVMGFAALVGRRHALKPVDEVIEVGARPTAEIVVQTVVAISLAASAAYAAAAIAVLAVTELYGYGNVVSLRVATPPFEFLALSMPCYVVARRFPWRIGPGLLAAVGYLILTEPHYLHSRWSELTFVQQARLTPWNVPDHGASGYYLAWTICIAGVALLVVLGSEHRTAYIGVAVALAISVATATQLYAGRWGVTREFPTARSIEQVCIDGGVTCVHPGYRKVLRSLADLQSAGNDRLESAGIPRLTVRQAPPGTVSEARDPVLVDLFGESKESLRISLTEGFAQWLRVNCIMDTVPKSALFTIAAGTTGLLSESNTLDQLREGWGIRWRDLHSGLSAFSC